MHLEKSNNIKITWTETGEPIWKGNEPRFNKVIKRLKWVEFQKGQPVRVKLHHGIAINKVITTLGLPKVSRIAVSEELAPYSFYGITAHYGDGQVDLYLQDSGVACTIIRADKHEMEVPKESLIKRWIEIANEYSLIRAIGDGGDNGPFGRSYFYECVTVKELVDRLLKDNWVVGQGYFHNNFCMINQQQTPNNWLCLRDGYYFDQLSIFANIGTKPGRDQRLADVIYRMLGATEEALKSHTY